MEISESPSFKILIKYHTKHQSNVSTVTFSSIIEIVTLAKFCGEAIKSLETEGMQRNINKSIKLNGSVRAGSDETLHKFPMADVNKGLFPFKSKKVNSFLKCLIK